MEIMYFDDEKRKSRLLTAVEWSDRQLNFNREKRIQAIKLLVGSHYSQYGSEKVEPVNFIKLALDIHVRALVARAPRVIISTILNDLKPIAANLEIAVNEIPEEIGLSDTLRKWVTEAIFGFGVVKVGLQTVGLVSGEKYGRSFVDVITLDNYFIDMAAESMDDIQFEGNDYWPIYEEIMESDYFGKKSIGDLKPDSDELFSTHGTDKAQTISVPKSKEEYKKRIHLRDVYLPGEGIVVTYAVAQKRIIKEREWGDAPVGPYHKLIYNYVPGNLLPLPNVSIWRDLHELGNALFRKLATQADSQKTVLGFSGDDEEAIKTFKDSEDGDGIRYNGPDPRTLTAGGIDSRTLAFYLQSKELASYFAGNIDSLGGLGPQAETIGQDRLISASASALLRDMSGRTIDAVKGVFKDLCYYEWTDPIRTRLLNKVVPGFEEMSVNVKWNMKSRKGKFSDYKLDIDVYSMIDDSPSLKLQRLGLIMQQYVLPLMPEIQRQGGQIDVQTILDLVAKYADFKELRDIVFFTPNGQMNQAEDNNKIQQYIGKSEHPPSGQLPGTTPSGKSDIMQRVLLGDKPQRNEMEIMNR